MDTLTSAWILKSGARVKREWVLVRKVAIAIILAIPMVACNQATPNPPSAPPIIPTYQPTPTPITPTVTLVPFSVLFHYADEPGDTDGARIRLVQSQEDVQGVQPLGGQRLLDLLNGVDFEQIIVVLLLRGTMGTTGYDIELQRVIVRKQDVFFDCRFISPGPDEALGAMLRLPFVAVTISRSDLPTGIETLVMLDQGVEVARQTVK